MAANVSPSDFRYRGARRTALAAVAGALVAAAFWVWPRSHPVRTAAAGETPGGAGTTTSAAWSPWDEAEMRRLSKLGYFDGDTIEVLLIGTVHAGLDTLPQLVKDLRRDAVVGGAGSRAIYPGLPSDSVYVVAGPHRPDGYDVDDLAIPAAARERFSSTPRPARLVVRDGDPPRGGVPSRVAQAEYRRLWWEGKLEWPEHPVRIVGVFPQAELARAGTLARSMGMAAVETGIGDPTVYPELAPGTVAVVVGPYRPERMAWAVRRVRRLERIPVRTLRVRDVRELGGWTPEEPGVPPVPPLRHYGWMDR